MKPNPAPSSVSERAGHDLFTHRVVKVRHDLRNPVGHIMGFSELLTEAAQKQSYDDCLADLTFLNQATDQIARRINSGLDSQKLPADWSELDRLETDLRQFGHDVVTATDRLRQLMADREDAGFVTDLERIAGAGRQLIATTAALATLRPDSAATGRTDDPNTSPLPAPGATLSPSSVVQVAPAIRTWKDGTILIVDNQESQREFVAGLIGERGYKAQGVATARQALGCLSADEVDLVLLDVTLQGEGGRSTLKIIKDNPATRHIPVLMLAGEADLPIAMACVAEGADDFLTKPVHPTILMARVQSALAKKRLHDQERAYLKRLQAEQDRSERLLLNVLPAAAARRLRQGEKVILEEVSEATVLIAGVVGFEQLREALPAVELLRALNDVFARFDLLTARHGLEKVHTRLDSYTAVAGLTIPRIDQPATPVAAAAADMALAMQKELAGLQSRAGIELRFRSCLSTGRLAAGVIGTHRFAYVIWGPAVDAAEELLAASTSETIMVNSATADGLGAAYQFEKQTLAPSKKEKEPLWCLVGRADPRKSATAGSHK